MPTAQTSVADPGAALMPVMFGWPSGPTRLVSGVHEVPFQFIAIGLAGWKPVRSLVPPAARGQQQGDAGLHGPPAGAGHGVIPRNSSA